MLPPWRRGSLALMQRPTVRRLRNRRDKATLWLHIEGSKSMKRIVLALVGLLAPLPLMTASAQAQAQAVRNYDCSKAGNANKTACKNAAVPAPVKPTTTRNYDCSKAGNANKAVCKAAAAPAAPSAAKPRNYDCSKAGNANKAVCKSAAPTSMAPAQRAEPTPPAPRAAPAAPHAPAVTGQNTSASGPNGATAKCRDNSLSYSAHRSGTCSRHGGVAQWF